MIRCTVSVHHKTGVEMEALTGASIAALTVYDMCKALSHDIVISDLRLLGKDGGKSSYVRGGLAMSSPVYGLILAGGSSSRMQRDKAALEYQGKSQLDRAFELAGRHVGRCSSPCAPSQAADPARAHRPLIVDSVAGEGPIVGIRSALAAHPEVAWLVLACDLPFLERCRARAAPGGARRERLATRPIAAPTTACRSRCARCGSPAAAALAAYQAGGGHCPRKFLMRHAARLIEPLDRQALDNVNTPEEYAQRARVARFALREPLPCNSKSSTTP